MKDFVSWEDFFEQEHIMMIGRGDHVFHVIPEKKDEEGNSFTEVLSKKAILEIAEIIKQEELAK